MRKVKAYGLLAAAVAAVPGVTFAAGGDEQPALPYIKPFSLGPQQSPGTFGLNPLTLRGSGAIGVQADGNFTWVGQVPVLRWKPTPPVVSDNNGVTWTDPANWSPVGVPDGAAAIANFNNGSGGVTVRLPSNITMSRINFADVQGTAIFAPLPPPGSPPVITMAGQARLDVPNQAPLGANNLFIGSAQIGALAIPADPGPPPLNAVPARPVVLGGSVGLNVTGGAVAFQQSNTYSGNTTISAGGLVTVNGTSIDNTFGTAGNVILDNGSIFVNIDTQTMSRAITVNAGGGTLYNSFATTLANHNYSGVISGPGNLVINNAIGASNATISGANTITGAVRISNVVQNFLAPLTGAGSTTFTGNGGFASASSVTISSGTGSFVRGAADANVDRLPNAGALNLHGTAARFSNANPAPMTETVGSTNLTGATSGIVLDPASGHVSVNLGTLTRSYAGSGLEVTGRNLGLAPASNTSQVLITGGAGLLVNGIIPFAYGNDAIVTSIGIESTATGLLTYGANGVAPFTGYTEFTTGSPGVISGTNATTNVRLDSTSLNQTYTLNNAAVAMNALVMRPRFDGDGNGVNGITLTGGGAANSLTLTTGVILSAFDGLTPLNAINSGIGNIIDTNVNVNTGTAQAKIMAPGALTFNGKLSGSGGLMKLGARTLFMNNPNNDYSGVTYLTAFNRFKGNVLSGANSAYGNSTTPIELMPADRYQDDPIAAINNATQVTVFAPDTGQVGNITVTRGLLVHASGADNKQTGGSEIRSFLGPTQTLFMNGAITVEAGANLTFLGTTTISAVGDNYNQGATGVISGPGSITVEAGNFTGNPNLTLTMNGTNTYTGGTYFHSGNLVLSNANALGTGAIITETAAAAQNTIGKHLSTTSNLTIPNGLNLDAAQTLNFEGSNDLTIGGTLITNGGVINVATGRTLTFNGAYGGGSAFIGIGAGNLVFNGGSADWPNQMQSGVQLTTTTFSSGGTMVYRGNNAAGSNTGASVVVSTNAIALDNGASIPDDFALFGTDGGVGGTGGLRGMGVAPTNIAGSVTVEALYAQENLATPPVLVSQLGSIGADTGSTLNIAKSVSTFDPGGVQIVAGAPSLVFLGNAIGVQKVGAGVVTVGSEVYTRTRIGGSTSAFNGSVLATGNLNVSAGTLKMTAHGGGLQNKTIFDVASLTVAPGAKLDITNNAGVVDYTGSSPLATIRALITQGYNGGGVNAWLGNGITTSMGNANNFAIGYAESAAVLTFPTGDAIFVPNGPNTGNVVDNTAVLIRFTRYGDANIDGIVNTNDFTAVAANFNQTGKVWSQGDFNYDTVVNVNDFSLLAANFNLAATGADGQPTPSDWANLAAAVPEPTSLTLVGLAGLGLLKRRRRH